MPRSRHPVALGGYAPRNAEKPRRQGVFRLEGRTRDPEAPCKGARKSVFPQFYEAYSPSRRSNLARRRPTDATQPKTRTQRMA